MIVESIRPRVLKASRAVVMRVLVQLDRTGGVATSNNLVRKGRS